MGRGRAQPFAQPEMCRDLPFRCGAKVLAISRVSTLLAAQAGAPGQASICRKGLFGVVIKGVLVALISPSSINMRHGVTVNVAVDGGAPALLRSEAQIAQMLARAVSLGARRM